MVKIKTIARSEKEFVRETKQDLNKVFRNSNPILHPFQKAREYQRALNATKIDKIFAKPFLGALQGHSDAISLFSKNPNHLTNILSGSFDGEIKAWDLSHRKLLFSINAHEHMIKGLCFARNSGFFLSSGDDKQINLYEFSQCINEPSKISPMNSFISKTPLNNLDHSYENSEVFASAGQIVQIWNYQRSNPIQNFEWGADSVLKVKFNPSETNLIASTGIDRSIVLYDLRGNTPLKKIFLQNKSQCLAWNPMEPINFTVGNDDGNCYSFDMRKMESAKNIHKDHIKAVMDIDFAPTGREFVTGSYDRTIRLFPINAGKSREVYHGQRMQKVFAVCYSLDNEYILSGSEDMNIRIWKAHASKPLGTVSKRQENSINYRQKLKEKFRYNKEIKKIQKHQHLPKYIYNAKKKSQIMKESRFKKMENQELNNPNIFVKPKPERSAKVVETID